MAAKKETNLAKSKKGKEKISFRPQEIVYAKYELDIQQQDILDALFSMVGSDGDSDQNYRYEIKIVDLKKRYGALWNQKRYTALQEALDTLWEKEFTVDLGDGKYKTYRWFSAKEYQSAKKDESIEISTISIDIHPEVKQMILKAKQGTFYNNSISVQIRNKYARKLYYQLLNKESLHREWIVPVAELRSLLGIPESYNYNMVKSRILETAKKEFEENADIIFTYKEIEEKTAKKGRTAIGAFAFIIKKKQKNSCTIDVKETFSQITLVEETVKILNCTSKEAINIVELATLQGYITEEDDSKYLEILQYVVQKNPESMAHYCYTIMKNGFTKPIDKEALKKKQLVNDFNNFKNQTYKDIDFESFEQQILSN